MSEPLLVVIDGPAGAGKSTVAQRLSRLLGLPLLDTGALYRALAHEARAQGVAWDDERGLAQLAERLPLELLPLAQGQAAVHVRCGDRVLGPEIRTPEIAEGASRVSALPAVRQALLGLQRALGARGGVAEGRDMGTVVFPHARWKFFLTADLVTRAARRREDLRGRGGEAPDAAAVEADLATRDARDAGRPVAPLLQAPDALLLDSSSLDVDEVVARILAHVAPELARVPAAQPPDPEA